MKMVLGWLGNGSVRCKNQQSDGLVTVSGCSARWMLVFCLWLWMVNCNLCVRVE